MVELSLSNLKFLKNFKTWVKYPEIPQKSQIKGKPICKYLSYRECGAQVFRRNTLTDLENELMDTCGEVYGGKRYLGSWDGHVHIAMFKMDNQQSPTE